MAGRGDIEDEPTVVIFRVWRARPRTVIALFPYIPGDNSGHTCLSFEHVGQHGDASVAGVINATRPATPEEYADLKRELESPPYEYDLIVRRRTPQDASKVRRHELRRS